MCEFITELADPATAAGERLLALKFVIHLVGDIHQPLHDADNHDKGGNCVLLNLGGPRQVNLHSYWDSVVVQNLGEDPQAVGFCSAMEAVLHSFGASSAEGIDPLGFGSGQRWQFYGTTYEAVPTVIHVQAVEFARANPVPN